MAFQLQLDLTFLFDMRTTLFFICLIFAGLSAYASGFDEIQKALKARDSVAKAYLPSAAILDTQFSFSVFAPGAKEIRVLRSANNNGITYKVADEEIDLMLGEDYQLVDSKIAEKAEFVFPVTTQEFSKNGGQLFLEILAIYPNNQVEKAVIFGSNANFRPTNKVSVLPKTQSKQSLAGFARSMIPGLGGGANTKGY